jgi:hypothetical protein
MHGADDASDADNLVATAVDTVRFDEDDVLVKNLLGNLPAEGVIALPEDFLEIPFKQCCYVCHDGSPQ